MSQRKNGKTARKAEGGSKKKRGFGAKLVLTVLWIAAIVLMIDTMRLGIQLVQLLRADDVSTVAVFRLETEPQPVETVPETVEVVIGETVYIPQLTRHVPYLFALEDGLLHPEAEFTPEMLQNALEALAEEGETDFFPQLPEGRDGMTAAELKAVLQTFFPETFEYAFNGQREEAALTRADGAHILNYLLERAEETVELNEESSGYPDVLPGKPENADVLEASVVHVPGGSAWADAGLHTAMEPGWDLRAGKLRYFDEDGYLKCNFTPEEGVTLGPDGYYTSGNAELDALVTAKLAEFQEEKPEASREDLLHMAYVYSRDSFKYLRRNSYNFGATGWEIEDAVTMMTTGKGNCYNYAAVFWALARGLGYDASVFAGSVISGSMTATPHSWVSIDFDGTSYYFDPELEMSRDKSLGINLYKMEKSHATGIWHYKEPTK